MGQDMLSDQNIGEEAWLVHQLQVLYMPVSDYDEKLLKRLYHLQAEKRKRGETPLEFSPVMVARPIDYTNNLQHTPLTEEEKIHFGKLTESLKNLTRKLKITFTT